MSYVYSTLTCDQEYALYPSEIDPKSIPKATHSIFVAGQCNVLNPKSFLTPKGMATAVTPEQLALLEKIPAFQRHKEAGYITVEAKKSEPDKVAKDMTKKDKSAQLVDSDFEADKKPLVNLDG